jgi:hypothetical protein
MIAESCLQLGVFNHNCHHGRWQWLPHFWYLLISWDWIDNFHSCTCRVTLVLVEWLNLPTACVFQFWLWSLEISGVISYVICTQKPPSLQCYGVQCALSLVNRWIKCGFLALSVRKRLQEDVVFIWSHALRNSHWVFLWTVNLGFINFIEHFLFLWLLVWMSYFVKWAACFEI